MFWKPHYYNRLSDDVCKRIYHSYYLKVFAFVRLVLGNDLYAKEITIDTLLQVCQNSDGYKRAALLAAIRHITADKCLEHLKKDSLRRIYYKDYLANDENSKILLDTDFKKALLLVMELNVLRKLPVEEYHEQMLKSPMVSELWDLARVDHFSQWESFKQQLDAVTIQKVNYRGKAAVALAVAAMAIGIILPVVHSVFIQRQYAGTAAVPPIVEHYFSTGKEPELILNNGVIIKLDSVPDDTFVGTGIPYKKKGSALIYEPLEPDRQTQKGMNILSIPPARQYQIRLTDGSMVWLGASSRLQFPDNFTGNERWVTVEGEAYFDVETNPKKPFTVKIANGVSVTAMGTSFNIVAYDGNDHISTALFEGKLKVNANCSGQSILLRPGEQAILKKGNLNRIKKCNEKQAIAWKKGWFDFDRKPIDEIMEEIEHWYNVKIIYGRKMPDSTFTGSFNRSKPLRELIKSISEGIGIPIEKRNDTLIVSPEK